MASAGPSRPLRRTMRGQPLLFLMTVLVCWTFARIIHHLPDSADFVAPSAVSPLPVRLLAVASVDQAATARRGSVTRTGMQSRAGAALVPDRLEAGKGAGRGPGPINFDTAMVHHRLWAQSLTMPHPGAASPLFDGPLLIEPVAGGPNHAQHPGRAATVAGAHKRWSIYAWSLLRPSGGDAALAPGAQYGGSQAGIILRYGLGDGPNAPNLYARAATALAGADDRTIALGVSARPWGAVPVDLALERRFGLADGQKDRFAAMLVAGGGARLGRSQVQVEAFAQAGLVGLRDRQGFFDLQMLATRPVEIRDRHTVSMGGGLWAGGQQEADASGARRWIHRVDIGPRAALAMPLGDTRMLVALDWRQRIDGDARPASGAALTLSTGF